VVAVILVAIRTFAVSGAAPDEERIQREMRKLG
jgi:hypothetical protein